MFLFHSAAPESVPKELPCCYGTEVFDEPCATVFDRDPGADPELYLTVGLGTSVDPHEEHESMAGDRNVWTELPSLLPL